MIKKENIFVVSIKAQDQKYGIQNHLKDLTNQQQMLLEREHIILNITIYQIKENMFYQNIKVMEKEDSHMDLGIHLLTNQVNRLKVIFIIT